MSESPITVTSSRYHRPLRVAVEGNISSGKSTFLSFCQRQPDLDVAMEPIDEWTNLDGSNLLVG